MAITFPLDLLTEGDWYCSDFDLMSAQNIGQTGGGVMPVVQVGNDLWRGRYQSRALRATEFDRYKALVNSLQGAMNTFLGWDVHRCKGIHYVTGGADAGDYSGVLTDVNANLHVVTIGSMPVGYKVKAGDYVKIGMNGNRYYYQFLEDATADGAGSLNTVDVRPHLPANWEDNATAIFNKPQLLMKIVPGSLSMQRSQTGWGVISFEAVQVLKEPT